MDFTSAFKKERKAKSFKKKKTSRAADKTPKAKEPKEPKWIKAVNELNNPSNLETHMPRDRSDDLNRDLEDLNLLIDDTVEILDDPEAIERLIPRNLQITQQEMAKRKVMDIRRWFCMGRAQYPKSCGISSLVSCWNYLFSTLGAGSKQPISTEEALEFIGFKPPYNNIGFGSFTGNDTLIQWFGLLNRKYGVRGEASIMFKLHGKSITHETDQYKALEKLKDGLRSERKAYIYHCYNHYMCPIGFEDTPVQPINAYSMMADISEVDTWIIIGEISKMHPCFHTKNWTEIVMDISCSFPEFFNIRKTEMGIQTKESEDFKEGKQKGGNLHCIIEFCKL